MDEYTKTKQKSYDKGIENEAYNQHKHYNHSKNKTMEEKPLKKIFELNTLKHKEDIKEEEEKEGELEDDIQIESNKDIERIKNSNNEISNNNETSGLKVVPSTIFNNNEKNPPNYIRKTMSQFKILKEGEIIRNIMTAEKECDNDYETNECFHRLKLEEFNTAYCTIVTIVSSSFYHEYTNFSNKKLYSEKPYFYECLCDICLALTLISSILFSKISIIVYIEKYYFLSIAI